MAKNRGDESMPDERSQNDPDAGDDVVGMEDDEDFEEGDDEEMDEEEEEDV